jgi:hypothetical protein
VLSNSVFSSFADAQNSVTSKPLVRWGSISNQWKVERVFQLFCIQLRGRIPPKQPQILISLGGCNLPRNAVSATRHLAKSHRIWTVDQMNASKYPLEGCRCPLPFSYLTLSQILDQTVLDWDSLTATCSQGWIDVIISSLFGGDAARLSVAISYGVSKCYASTHNLVTIIKSFCDGSMMWLCFRARCWTNLPFW